MTRSYEAHALAERLLAYQEMTPLIATVCHWLLLLFKYYFFIRVSSTEWEHGLSPPFTKLQFDTNKSQSHPHSPTRCLIISPPQGDPLTIHSMHGQYHSHPLSLGKDPLKVLPKKKKNRWLYDHMGFIWSHIRMYRSTVTWDTVVRISTEDQDLARELPAAGEFNSHVPLHWATPVLLGCV
jgi:hypothetical protein